MRYIEQVIDIKTVGSSDNKAKLVGYIPDTCDSPGMNRIMPAVLILPGGGYEHVSTREGEPVAFRFIAQGISAFVLKYSVAPARFPQALCEAAAAMNYIRENAQSWHIDPNKIAVCGFSAGGHLAASLSAFWKKDWLQDYTGILPEMIRPNLLVLSYPVITSGEFGHQGSMEHLLGNNISQEMLKLNSLEKQVSKDIPPTFIWHTYEDGSVSVKNTMLFGNALIEEGIPVELHIYRRGKHGLSLGNFLVSDDVAFGQDLMVSNWIDQAIRFIYEEKV